MDKFSKSLKVYKRSSIYLGGCIAFAFFIGLGSHWAGRKYLFG
jgi:hypothetical protein